VPAGPGCQGCDVGAWEVLRVEEIPPHHGAVRRETHEGPGALGWRIGSVCGQQPKPRPLVRAGDECGVRRERAQRNLQGYDGGDRAAREAGMGEWGRRMQAQ